MTAADLFKSSVKRQQKFIVPIYQRVFTWGEREVGRLICDLYEHFKKSFDDDYYLGVITVVANKDGDFILVDGQQRLTCLMLLGALLGWNMDYDRLDYECRPSDTAAKDMLKNGWKKGLLTGNSAMDNFFRCAESLKDETGESVVAVLKDRYKDHEQDIASHIKLLISELPKDPYRDSMKEQNRYFEKMNAGGRQLEPHEILKVRICAQCANQQEAFNAWNRATDFAHDYKAVTGNDEQGEELSLIACFGITDKLPEPQGGGEERMVNRESVITLPMFLLHVLALIKGENAEVQCHCLSGWREDRLLDAFGDFPPSAEMAATFVQKMEDYREFLDKNIIYLSYDKNQNAPSYVLSEETDAGAREKLKQFQAMLFAADGGRHGKHKWLLDYYDGKNWNLKALKDIDKKEVPWNSDEPETMESYVDTLCYQMQSRWLFWRLDYLLWEKIMDAKDISKVHFPLTDICVQSCPVDAWPGTFCSKDSRLITLVKNYMFHLGRSIEHLHPQTDSLPDCVGWNEAVAVDGEGRPTIRQKDRFWNLCLLTPSQNSMVGNDSVGVKFKRVEEMRSGLPSIKLLMMYMECGGLDVRWDCNAAKRHLSRMKAVLKASYLCGGKED